MEFTVYAPTHVIQGLGEMFIRSLLSNIDTKETHIWKTLGIKPVSSSQNKIISVETIYDEIKKLAPPESDTDEDEDEDED
jgi:hypothetical protein